MIDFTQKSFGVISLGCDKNRVDSEKLLSIIKERGAAITNDISAAQILIVNTCAFLNEARREAIETVLDCAIYKNDKLEKLVVTGCLPQKYVGEIFETLIEADMFLGIKDYDQLFIGLERAYSGERVNLVDCGSKVFYDSRVITTPQHYAYLKIADGCNNRCTYCLIPKIRGKYESYPIERLLREAENLGDVSELILVAQDVTRYGIDLYGQNKLKEILQKLTALVNINSVRLLYCYPDMIDDGLIEEMKNNNKIVKYLDIPLQHSEDRILKLMNRKGSRSEYLKLFETLRNNIPDIALRSTFITGFPTESEEEVENLCEFLRKVQLDNCGFFAYSREPDTAAYKLKGQVSYAEKRKRVKKLYSVQREISADKLKTRIGTTVKVLCDGIDYDRNCFFGRGYFSAPDIDGKIYFNANRAVQGEYYDVKIENSNSYDLFGKTEDFNL